MFTFFILARLFGILLSRKIFSLIFLVFGHFFKSKKVIENNLNTFSKNISNENKEKIISNMWKNYGATFIEYIFLDLFRKNDSHIKIEGEKILNKIKERNKPVIFVSGHFANFELMSMEITKKNIKLATVYRPLNNFLLNPLMEFLRKKYVCKHQIKKGLKGVKDSINYIQKGYSIALMIDQRVSEGEKINFFSKPASTTTLPAQLAIKYGLSIIPVFIERTEKNNFVVQFQDSIDTSNFDSKVKLTQRLNEILEEMIVRNPNQWIWTHNRWK
ncbi:lysophospholipid acyltransferase family protein [Pelagibacteraceae bacterium]|nr:lysophospholipid acyltransferase family protein [Pelagibacteraceae bacterium]